MHVSKRGRGLKSPEERYLQTTRYAERLNDEAVGRTEIDRQ